VRSLALAAPASSPASSAFHQRDAPQMWPGYDSGGGALGPGSLATSYRSPYRSKQPAFFRGTTSFTAAGALDSQAEPSRQAEEGAEEGTPPDRVDREPSRPVKGETSHRVKYAAGAEGRPTHQQRYVDEHPSPVGAPMTPVTARAFGQGSAAPYVSPFRSSAPAPLASPGRTSSALLQSGGGGSGVARWTSLSVSQGSSSLASSSAFGGARAAVGTAGAVAERRERQAYEEERLEERRQKPNPAKRRWQ